MFVPFCICIFSFWKEAMFLYTYCTGIHYVYNVLMYIYKDPASYTNISTYTWHTVQMKLSDLKLWIWKICSSRNSELYCENTVIIFYAIALLWCFAFIFVCGLSTWVLCLGYLTHNLFIKICWSGIEYYCNARTLIIL